MTSYMNIMVRVVSGRAMAQMQALRAAQAGVTSGMVAANRVAPLGRAHISSLMKFGNQLQWTGRMIQYNFTLPILAAGVAATTWSMQQAKAMTHVAKVYGDVKDASAQFRKESQGIMTQMQAETKAHRVFRGELSALDDAFTAISNHYGIQKKEVLEVAGAWAAAGASGVKLARSVDNTMKAMIIGDMESGAATKALISIQAQYNLSTGELMATLANLNSVENQTGASMSDLITGFEKAAGVARSAGVETKQLAAYIAALVPATGTASTAGQALKTIFSRLLAPTQESAQVMEAMGISVKSLGWQSATVSERLQIMAQKFEGLGGSAQNAASAVVASRWQINKFDVLMRELVSSTGYYAKALSAAEDQGASFKRMQQELNTVLESDPRKLQRMWVMLQNASVEIIQPLIPFIIYLANSLARLAQSFADLEPHTQKLIIFGLVFLAFVGPVVKYMGALTTLGAVFGVTFLKLGAILLGFGKIFLAALFTPMKMLGSLMLTSLGAVSSIMIGFFSGLATIAGVGWAAVVAVWTGASKIMTAITTISWAVQIGIWRTAFALKLLAAKIFWVKMKVLWLGAQIFTATRWAAFWLFMKTISIASMGSITAFTKKFMVFMGRAMTVALGPWGIAIAIVLGILYTFRDQIKQIFNNAVGYVNGSAMSISGIFSSMGQAIHDVFNSLPQGIQNALVAVVTVVRDAALAVYEWFQYINPFARHSPSLVDNVTNGMTAVQRQFGRLSSVKGSLSAAYAEIKRFGKLTAGLGVSAAQQQRGENRKTLKKAGGGAALGSYNKLTGTLTSLQPVLDRLEVSMDAQQRVVDIWQSKVDKANNKLEAQQSILDRLQGTLDKYKNKLSAAQESLQSFASAPLEGMREMEQRIFRNSNAQNKLRLEMMKMEDVNGTFDDMKAKLDAINGAQELMLGEQSALRSAGAGSEILSQYDKEMSKLDEQKAKYVETADKLSEMQVQLDALQRQGEKLDLVKAMKFDELQFRIQQAVDLMKEMSFDEIMAGIRGAKDEIAKYGPKVDEATAAVDRQQKVVDALTAARDRLQNRLDREQTILDKIANKYNKVHDAISAINSAISDVISSADKMNQALAKKKSGSDAYISPGLQNFLDAGKADFADPGGKGMPPRKDWGSQKAQIKKFTEKLGMDTATMFADLNPFAPLKDKALKVWDWIKDKAGKTAGRIGDFFSHAFDGVGMGDSGSTFSKMFDSLKGIGKFITKVIKDVAKIFKWGWELIGPDVKKIWHGIVDGFSSIWDQVGPELKKFVPLMKPLGKAIQNVWKIAKPVLALFAAAFLLAVKLIASVIGKELGPALDAIGTILKGAIKVIRGILEVFIGIFTGDWKMMWQGVKDIFGGMLDGIVGILKLAWAVIKGVFLGIVKGIYGFFKWLYDKLIGHSIIPDIVDGIFFWFDKLGKLPAWVWKNVLKPVYESFKKLWNDYVKPAIRLWWSGIKAEWAILKTVAGWVWDNILKPVFTKVKALWDDNVGPALRDWWGKIKDAWATLKGAGAWVWDNVLQPVFEKFKSAFTSIRAWMQDHISWIVDPFKAVVSGIVGAINWIIKGINMLDKLPGVSISISTITLPEGFEQGGVPKRRVGSGFKTNGARAIVGEGKANHPEFVIPTDPTYRKRAKSLLGMAAGKLGVNLKGALGDSPGDIARVMKENPGGSLPKFGIGGWIADNAGDLIGGAIDLGKDALSVGKNVMQNTMKPYVALARTAAGMVDWSTGRDVARGGIDLASSWAGLASKQFQSEWQDAQDKYVGADGKGIKDALQFAKSQVGDPYVWGGVGPDGYDCSGFMSALTNVARGKSPYSRVGATATFPWAGFSTMGPFNPSGFVIGSNTSYAGGVGHMAGTIAGVNVESSGGVGVRVGAGARGYTDSGFTTRAQLTGLKHGGIVRARVGGILANIGEGGHDEAVTPLPRNWKTQGFGGTGTGHTTNNFYGDLEFPNVKDGSDAEEFLKNLEILSKD